MELALVLDRKNPSPLQEQLSDQLRRLIQQGSLNGGHQLPSTRNLAEQLGVARVTVTEAYTKLKAQGFIEFKRNARPVVIGLLSESFKEVMTPLARADVSSHLNSLGETLSEMEIVRSTSADLPELGFGAADLANLPVRQWQILMRQTCEKTNWANEIHSVEDLGYRPLRAAIAEYVGRTRGIHCSAENVIVFGSSQQALYMIASLLVQDGDVVAMENPGFVGARQCFEAFGASIEPLEVDLQGAIVLPLLEGKVSGKLAYVSSLHQDPKGAVMPLERRQQLCRWAQVSDSLIVEDDFDYHFRAAGKAVPAIAAVDRNHRVIYLSSFWKALYPLCQVGFVIVPDSLIDAFHRAKLLSERSFSLLENVVLARFVSGGNFEQYIERSRKIVMERRRALIIALAQCFGKDIDYNKNAGGTHLCVAFPAHRQQQELLEAAHTANLPMVPTERYYVGSGKGNEFLIHFSNLEAEDIHARVTHFANLLAL